MITLEKANKLIAEHAGNPFWSPLMVEAMETVVALYDQLAEHEKAALGGPPPFCFCPMCGEWTNGQADGQYLLRMFGGNDPYSEPMCRFEPATNIALACKNGHRWMVNINITEGGTDERVSDNDA